MNSGGLRAKPTPSGVPVAIIIPGRSVMPTETHEMMESTGWIISEVVPSCLTVPLTVRRRLNAWGSSTSSGVTTQGPLGHDASRLLPLKYWPPQSL